MSAGSNNSGSFSTTLNLPAAATGWGVGFWVRATGNNTGYGCVFGTDDGSGYNQLSFNSGTNALQWYCSSGDTTLSISGTAWRYVFISVTSGTTAILRHRLEGATAFTNVALTFSASYNKFYICNNLYSELAGVAEIRGFKLWSAILSEPEAWEESLRLKPKRRANLHSYLPFDQVSGADQSGNGNTWTQAGTPIISGSEPVVRRGGAKTRIFVPSVGGAPTNATAPVTSLTLSAPVPTVGATQAVSVPTAALALSAPAPSASVGGAVAPAAALTLAALAPTVTATQPATVPKANLTLQALAPVADDGTGVVVHQAWSHVGAGYTGQYWANGEPCPFRDVAGNGEHVWPAIHPTNGLKLFVSGNKGSSWSAISNSAGGSVLASGTYLMSCVQSSDGKVHILTCATSAGSYNYTRLTLNYSSGAIATYTVDSGASNVSMGPSASGDLRGAIQVVRDQSGTECLMLVCITNGSGGMDVHAQKTLTTTPANGAAWTKLDGTSGATLVLNQANVDGNNHEYGSCFEQIPSTGAVWVFASHIPAEGFASATACTRVKLTPNGAHTWSVGSGTAGNAGDHQRSICAASDHLILLRNRAATGLQLDTIDASDTYTANAISSPGSTAGHQMQAAIACSPDGQRIFYAFQTWTPTGTPVSIKRATTNRGSSWTSYSDTLNDLSGDGDSWGMKRSTGWSDGLVVLRNDVNYGDFSSWVSVIYTTAPTAVTAALVGLTFSALAPTVVATQPAAAPVVGLTFSRPAPTAVATQAVSAPAVPLQLSAPAPTAAAAQSAVAPAVALALSAPAPTAAIGGGASAPLVGLSLQAVTPVVTATQPAVAPAVALALVAQAPSAVATQPATPPAVALGLTANTPSAAATQPVAAPAVSLTVQARTLSSSATQPVSPAAVPLALSAPTPIALQDGVVAPPVAALALAALTPTVVATQSVAAPAVALGVLARVPTAVATQPAAVPAAGLSLSAPAPSAAEDVTTVGVVAPRVAFVLQALAPTVVATQGVQPPAAVLTLHAPSPRNGTGREHLPLIARASLPPRIIATAHT